MKLLMDWLIFIRKKGTRRHLFTNYVRFSKFEALELYEITPFSNNYILFCHSAFALELYEITPFSNWINLVDRDISALELYEITPFSNGFLVTPDL